MSSRGAVFQPVGQKRLTNIAVVRLKKAGIRFEIACYQNKVRDWRNGIEKDIDEVLQTTTIFNNVSKGIAAKEADLMTAFGTTDEEVITQEILRKGDLQVADKERKVEYDNLFRDVACVLVEKCVNPETSRPYTITMLERALRDAHFNVDPKRGAKQQALEALPMLQAKFPIERARMRLKLTAPTDRKAQLVDMVESYDARLEGVEDHAGGTTSVVAQVEPGAFRELHNRLQAEMGGGGRIEVLSMAVIAEGVQADQFAHLPANGTGMGAAGGHGSAPAPASTSASAAAASAAAYLNGSDNVDGVARSMAGASVSPRTAAAPTAAPAAAAAAPRSSAREPPGGGASGATVVYACGPVSGLPEEHASRKERFAELDTLQAGWQVELRAKGETVEAVFYSPAGKRVGAYATARRAALAAHKAGLS
ncbi:hypothetical protein FOA52_010851 [Chlamydomonas sp. UWO 241]|nr:hypothetical protein FOA52_010851 [Chlamydomonas sp. UWO 241]